MCPKALLSYITSVIQENLKILRQGNSFHVNKKLLEKGRQLIGFYSIGPKVMGLICNEGYLSQV